VEAAGFREAIAKIATSAAALAASQGMREERAAGGAMAAGRDPEAETEGLIRALGQAGGPVVFVSNEVGLGIVPDNTLARAFRDHAGRMNQRLAGVSNTVFFVAAGLPLQLK